MNGIMLGLLSVPFPARSVILNPAVDTSGTYLGGIGAWASYGGYLPDTTYAWSVRIGGLLDILRVRDITLCIYGANELVAGPESKIRFQPLALYWEEGALLSRGGRGYIAQVGFTHRCKHDIDRDERTLIFSSVHAGVIRKPFYTRAHKYVLWLDDPTGRITGLTWSWETGIRLRASWGWGPYLCADVKLDGYPWATYADTRAETGVFVTGAGATLMLFLEYERLHDPGIYRPVDDPVVFQIGLRATDGRRIF
ncbi:MAG: hypothetical protein ABIM46_03150 [candidate division WOR-3 bacterium]